MDIADVAGVGNMFVTTAFGGTIVYLYPDGNSSIAPWIWRADSRVPGNTSSINGHPGMNIERNCQDGLATVQLCVPTVRVRIPAKEIGYHFNDQSIVLVHEPWRRYAMNS